MMMMMSRRSRRRRRKRSLGAGEARFITTNLASVAATRRGQHAIAEKEELYNDTLITRRSREPKSQ
jgi:hypothetical protein